MSDYEHCKKHNISFLMPELLMCPQCAVEAVHAGHIQEPLCDALSEAIKVRDARIAHLVALLREARPFVDHGVGCGALQEITEETSVDVLNRLTAAIEGKVS